MSLDAKSAMELYIYGYPLVYCTNEILRSTGSDATLIPGGVPFNEFGKARQLLGPEVAFVSPNNDTLYVNAAIDLSGGSILLHTPDTAGRYYVLQFIDPWSNNFAYLGHRATGTAAADWLLVRPDHHGEVPEGATTIEFPNDVAVIVGRVQVDGEADLAAVHDLQDHFTLAPYGPPGALHGIPAPDDRVSEDLQFWEQLRLFLRRFPAPPADQELLDLCAEAGLLDEESAFLTPDPKLAATLAEGKAKGAELIESLASGAGADPGTWTSALHMFDYNLDRLGIGTIDAPEWKIPDRKKAYVTRAVAARAGLWGNHGYEADYEIIHQDEHGDTLNGAHRYELTFDPPPPAKAFWSLTMYDTPSYYLVSNPIDRYSIGDRTPGLVYNHDGSVTIHLQAATTAGDEPPNWLPAPPGDFRPILRMYEPGRTVLDGTYRLPKIKRLG